MTKAFVTAFKLAGDFASYNRFVRQAVDPEVTVLFGDRDNICHPGPEGGAFAQIHVARFAAALAAAQVQWATILSHRAGAFERRLYAKNSIQLIESGENCDDQVITACKRRIARGDLHHLILMTGDHYACEVAELAAEHGVTTEVWARSGRISRALARSVSRVRVIDDFLLLAPTSRPAVDFRIAA